MDAWVIGTLANGLLAAAYLSIAAGILLPVLRSGQWRTNPLALATGLIFLSCGCARLVRVVEASTGIGATEEFRTVLADWRINLVDGLAAISALWYLALRRRFPGTARGSVLFEDVEVRRRQALEIHDNIVQGLVRAKLHVELGNSDSGVRAIEETLAASRGLITQLLEEPGGASHIQPGDLRRSGPAGASP